MSEISFSMSIIASSSGFSLQLIMQGSNIHRIVCFIVEASKRTTVFSLPTYLIKLFCIFTDPRNFIFLSRCLGEEVSSNDLLEVGEPEDLFELPPQLPDRRLSLGDSAACSFN